MQKNQRIQLSQSTLLVTIMNQYQGKGAPMHPSALQHYTSPVTSIKLRTLQIPGMNMWSNSTASRQTTR